MLEQKQTKIGISSATTAMSVDPLCEKYYWISPYVYTVNNPIRFIDPNGMDIWEFDQNGKYIQRIENKEYDAFHVVDAEGNKIAETKIYLEPMDKTNVVAEMLLELARGYWEKYGYDDFYLKCINTAEQYLKNKLNARILKSAYQTRLTMTLAYLLNAPKPEIMEQISPDAYKHFELMQAQYKEIDNMGYEETPIAVYAL